MHSCLMYNLCKFVFCFILSDIFSIRHPNLQILFQHLLYAAPDLFCKVFAPVLLHSRLFPNFYQFLHSRISAISIHRSRMFPIIGVAVSQIICRGKLPLTDPLVSLITSSIFLYGTCEKMFRSSSAIPSAMAILVRETSEICPVVSNRLMEP